MKRLKLLPDKFLPTLGYLTFHTFNFPLYFWCYLHFPKFLFLHLSFFAFISVDKMYIHFLNIPSLSALPQLILYSSWLCSKLDIYHELNPSHPSPLLILVDSHTDQAYLVYQAESVVPVPLSTLSRPFAVPLCSG